MAANDTSLCAALDKLFVAFPLHSHRDDARHARKQQYQLYHERLASMPVDLVHASILELIDTARYLPSLGIIRARVQARIAARIPPQRAPHIVKDSERAKVAQTVAQVIHSGKDEPKPVIGTCSIQRYVDGHWEVCGEPYEYSKGQAGWLVANRQHLLCHTCAGEYLTKQGLRRRREEAWARSVLASMSPNRRPDADTVKELRALGFGQELQTRLVEIGAYTGRRPDANQSPRRQS